MTAKPSMSPTLEHSSAIRKRAMEIYKVRLGQAYSPDRWNDCEFSAAWREAREEIEATR